VSPSHPSPGQDDETAHVDRPFDNLHAQDRHLGHGGFNLPGVVAAIGPEQFERRVSAMRFAAASIRIAFVGR
jgi:hypothetical protein